MEGRDAMKFDFLDLFLICASPIIAGVIVGGVTMIIHFIDVKRHPELFRKKE